jgi:hypothetical protein
MQLVSLLPLLLSLTSRGAKQVVLLRVYYPWKFFTPLIGKLMGNFKPNTYLLSSAATFRNEPY